MIDLSKSRSEVNVVNDQIGSPTLAEDLAKVTANILLGIEQNKLNYCGGVFHATGGGVTNWYEFSKAIFKIKNIDIQVNPIPTSEFPTPAPRPKYSVLSNKKLAKTYKLKLPHWQDSLVRCLEN